MNNILKNWDFARIIKLIAGIGISLYAITEKEYSFMFLAGFLFLQAILNISCCGAGGCSSSINNNQKEVFKGEIKQYKPEK